MTWTKTFHFDRAVRMTKFTILRTNMALPDEAGLAGARNLLFKCLDGMGEDARKAWRKFWGRVVKMEPGEIVEVEMVFTRNPHFHRKFFALLTVGFEAWHPDAVHKGQLVAKNFEQFRGDVIILAGYYTQTWNLDGVVTVRPQSMSFAAMDDAKFEKLYSAVADVLLARVLSNYKDRAELDAVVDKMLEFL